MERAKGSAIWSYFTLPKPASSTATCNICKVNVPRGGTKPSSFNTTNLIKHLQKFKSHDPSLFPSMKLTVCSHNFALFFYIGIGSVSADTKPQISVSVSEVKKADRCIPIQFSLEVMKLFYSPMVVSYLERNMGIPGTSINKVA